MALTIAALGAGLAVVGAVYILWSVRRWLSEWWRVWRIRHRFQPPPPEHQYHLIRFDLPNPEQLSAAETAVELDKEKPRYRWR
jgi:hypothetical protein